MLTDIESEKNVLATMLNDEPGLITCLHELTEQDFYEPKHLAIFNTITGLYTKSIKPTYMEVSKELVKTGLVDMMYMIDLSGYYITSETLGYWINNVKQASRRRRFKTLLIKAVDQIKGKQGIDDILTEFETSLMDLHDMGGEIIDTGEDMARIGFDAIEEARNNKGQLLGIHTGIGKLNRLTGGWKPGDLVIVAAETGRGKTAFSLNFIDKSCFWLKNPTFYINSEMSKKQVMFRVASILSGVENDAIKFGQATDSQWPELANAMAQVAGSPFFHYRSPSLELKKIIPAIRKMKIQQDVKLVVVDYVGRMEKVGKDLKEWQILEQIVKTLKTVAQELEVAVMVLAQLTDEQKLQGAKRMENEADIFMQLLPMTNEQMQESAGKYLIQPNYFIYVKKNRDGQSGVYVPVYFEKETLRVVDVNNQQISSLGREVQVACPF